GLRGLIDVGISPDDLAERQARLVGNDWIALTSGLHPSQATRPDRAAMLDLLASQAADGGIVAVGEIGLDYHWDTGKRADAMDLFDAQLAIAEDADLPVVIHNREADNDVLDLLRRRRPRGVMHCFSQTPEFCRRCLDLDLYISFGGNLTFKGSGPIRESVAIVPLDRLLVETDAPYLSPVPVRGRPNHPAHLGFTLRAMAEQRSLDVTELATATARNAIRLFGL
ncbi:MAG: TatD family hydrolase, partial [Spirochaetales bacterium]|nr:TatD family hydrolase [Spirochaetales bacterium]